MTQPERIKEIRKHNKLTMEQFGDRVGVTKATISRIESGVNGLTDQMIISICREFGVNEKWLRYGEGDMFIPEDRMTQIAKLTRELLSEESDSFKNRLVVALSKLNIEQWEALEALANELNNKKD